MLVTGEKRVTIQVVHTYRRLKVRAITICSRTSHRTLRARLTARTVYVNPTGTDSSCLGVADVLDTTIIAKTRTVRPNFKFLSRGDTFTAVYRRVGVQFVKPSSAVVSLVNGGTGTHGAVVTTSMPIAPKDRNCVSSCRRTIMRTRGVNCPIVLGTTTNNKNGKVQGICRRGKLRTTFDRTGTRTGTTFKSSDVCLRGVVAPTHRVRIRVLNSSFKGIIRLNRHSYSLRHGRRGILRRDPSAFVSRRAHGTVKSITVQTTGRINCAGTKAVRFLISARRQFCFVRVGAHVRIRRPMARVTANVSVMGRRLHVTDNRPLSFARSRIIVANRAVRYHVGTRGPTLNFHPSSKGVSCLFLPDNKGKLHIRDTVCNKCVVPPFCSSVVTGVVAGNSGEDRTVTGVEHTLRRLIVRKISAGRFFRRSVLRSPGFVSKSCSARCLRGIFLGA